MVYTHPIQSRLIWHAKAYVIRRVAAGTLGANLNLSPLDLMCLTLYTSNAVLSEEINRVLLKSSVVGGREILLVGGAVCSEDSTASSSSTKKPPRAADILPADLTPNLKNFTAVLYRALTEKLPPLPPGSECFLASAALDRKLYQKGTEFVWNHFVSTTALWKVALENVPSFASKNRRGTVLLLKTAGASTAGRSLSQFSEFPHDAEVLFPPGIRFRVTNWYHGDVVCLGQANIRESTFGIKEVDGERQNLAEVAASDKSLVIELTEIVV